jgi:Tol biopolymer transport system component
VAIQPGTRLGPYEVLSAIGAGGMGEVYRAHDTLLNRDVALKVLPEAFSRDIERMARFEREAKLLASLNHPNIAAIYGLEISGPIRALVMELVEGPTLADRIRAGAIPIDEALPIARQIADAVEYAHDKNVIHRDLKPANIKVKEDGTVKVLDFGLAKAMSEEVAEADMANSPTLSMAATRAGVILGTAAYMSPEQAKGKSVDRRTDVWAFGAVLYEMLTGKQAFAGEDITEVLAAVVMREPTFDMLPAKTPSAVRGLLRRCLEKNPKRRLAHIAEARILLEDVLSGAVMAEAVMAGDNRTLGRPALLLSIGTGVLAAAIAGMVAWTFKPAPATPHPVSRFDYDVPQNLPFRNAGRVVMALSPDGSRFVYNTTQGLYLRSMDQLEARLIPGTEATTINPFFSPDGQWVGYWQESQLKKIAISGGAPTNICAAQSPLGVNWAPDNTILFGQTDGIRRVSADGGTPELVIKPGEGEQVSGPQLLPGGEWVLFAVSKGATNWDEATIVVQSLKTQERREVWRGGSDARYVSTGHIVYALGGDLFAIPFDLDSLKVNGGPVSLVQGVLRALATDGANYGISDDGAMVYVVGGAAVNTTSLVWVDRTGKEEAVAAPPQGYFYPRIAPDGQRAAVSIVGGGQIWLYDLRRNTLTRWTFEGNVNYNATWTPDGQRIAFISDKAGPLDIHWQRADGSGGSERLTTSQDNQAPSSWSPDGLLLAFSDVAPKTGYDIWVMPMGDTTADSGQERKPKVFLQTPFNETSPRFSPDGHWLAYVSNESGRNEVYVQPYPGPGGKYQISTDGGTEAVWNPNGREIFYRSGDKMMAVEVTTGSTFSIGQSKVLFQGPYLPTPTTFPNYDVSLDGRRFLMVKNAAGQGQSASAQIVVVQNWIEELKRRVPTGTK